MNMKRKIKNYNASFFILIISLMLIIPTVAVLANQKEEQIYNSNYIFDETYKNDSITQMQEIEFKDQYQSMQVNHLMKNQEGEEQVH